MYRTQSNMKLFKELFQIFTLHKTKPYFLINNSQSVFNQLNYEVVASNIARQLAYTQQANSSIIQNRKLSIQISLYNSAEELKHKSDDKKKWWQANYGGKKWWQTSSEFKILASLVFGLMSYLFTMYTEKRRAAKQVRLDHVNQQIKLLYGPLYGNRLIQQRTYEAVMGKHGGLKNYLKIAQKFQDAEMLRRWRSFVSSILYPLDKEAEALICKNAHLIVDNEFPQAFNHFLSHVARLQFVMERWKSEDGKLKKVEDYTPDDFLKENNVGDRGVKEMVTYVEDKFRELKEVQKKLKVEVKVEDGEYNIISLIFNLSRFK